MLREVNQHINKIKLSGIFKGRTYMRWWLLGVIYFCLYPFQGLLKIDEAIEYLDFSP